ncbi:glycosyl hydrolase [Catenovulum sediminis]|uniref:Glycosyl hydrolase n=1 Tax=Catenovulum sediminis TaxID=1740262 RepID=A0ABV1RCA9_9ALTE
MTSPFNKKPLVTMVSAVLLAGLNTACVEEGSVNADSAQYTPEERPLGVIAGADIEQSPGEMVTVAGRLVGTVTDQSLRWTQIAGSPITIADNTKGTLTFEAPEVDGLEVFKFKIEALDKDGNVIVDENNEEMTDEVTVTIFNVSLVQTLEAEDASIAELVGSAQIVQAGDDHYLQGASGDAHTADIVPGAAVKYTLNLKAEEAAYYAVFLRYAIPADYGGKVGMVTVNGVPTELELNATGSFQDVRVGVFNLTEGQNIIEVGGGWNYYRVDNVQLKPAAPPATPDTILPKLVNENATDPTVKLMEFLVASYGEKTLSGQAEFPTNDGSKNELVDFAKIKAATTDDLPAIVEFDLMEYSSSRVAKGAKPGTLSEDAIEAHNNENVIVGMAWHWNAPTKLKDGSGNEAWNRGFYTEATDFDLAAALADKESDDYKALIADIDIIATELAKFADADIPVLWRPIHEAEGEWFWWGASGADAFKELWQIMYDRLTTQHNLNNLIWVYTGAGSLDENWYPGDEMVDIVGYDGYDGVNDDNPFSGQFATLLDRFNGKKLIAITETGSVPDVAKMHAANAWWAYFVTWYSREWNQYGPGNMDAAIVDENYAFENVINLDEVPGGVEPQEAGTYSDFEMSTHNWEAQVSWSPTTGLYAANDWAADGAHSLILRKDLKAEFDAAGKLDNIVFQTYPVDGIDVSGQKQINVYVKSLGAGDNVTAHIFWKSDSESWPAGVAVTNDSVVKLTSSLTELPDGSAVDISNLSGLGVRFEGLDTASTNATFYIDRIELVDGDDKVSSLYTFEPDVSPWHGQVNWGTTSGATFTTDYAKNGVRSLAMYKDLTAYEAVENVVLQAYPEGGVNVTDYSSIKVSVASMNVGDASNAHIFYKAADGIESWPAATNLVDGKAELSIDLTDRVDADDNPVTLSTINGLGVRFQGLTASENAMLAIDDIKLVKADASEKLIYGFENTGAWEFQVNWSPAAGIHLSSDWMSSGKMSLAGKTQLADGDDNIILQTYPADGIKLGNVTTLKVTAHATDSGASTQVMLFAKDENDNWKDSGAVDLAANGTELTLDLTQFNSTQLNGFGVRFINPDNSTTESSFFVDNVRFE